MTGTARLIRLILRRDRFIMPIWVFVLGILPAAYVTTIEGLFSTDAERLDYALISRTNAGFVALYGQLRGDSVAEMAIWRAGFVPVMLGVAVALTVIRHTRADEEAGRTELIGAGVVGRRAPLAAALITTMAACLVLGVIATLGLVGQGLPVAGSLWSGVELTVSGWAFTGFAAIAAQLTGSARGARSIAVLAVGLAYVLRLGGDLSAMSDGPLSWLSWVSPIGWVQHIYPYGAADWWPAELTVVFAAAATAAGVVLLGHRDLGAGLFPGRPGPATAARSLRTPLALAWRLHRGLLIGWAAAFAALGLVFGAVGQSVADLGSDTAMGDIFARMGGSEVMVNSYFASIAGMVGILAACYAVQATLRMRDEETAGHAEMILTAAATRRGWAAGHLFFSLLGPAVLLLVEGLVSGAAYGAITGDNVLGDVLAGAVTQLPAVWTLAGVAALLTGLLPRWSALAWGAVSICLLVLLVGTTLQLDQWLLDISPFTHVPHLPVGDLSWTPLVALTVVAAALVATALVTLRRRDIPA
ncbi:ABC transporter permease [Actinoplanes sp. NBRC 103695]|uniref:ABC transporter permease n=1 Tax=Actinoplanes sp. NBRC 103695 TaxID=3032202 RepID=UPI0024A0F59D|nr:ABC transporter permease [Actinoplanes sp. NBRC 103695]GLZ01434.1 exporter of polyketide antibiotics [Actinoplanes sp. NBRC 103695]